MTNAVDERVAYEQEIPLAQEQPGPLTRSSFREAPDEPRPVRQSVVREPADPRPAPPAPEWPVHSDDITQIAAALAAAQGKFGEVERTLRAKVESRRTGTSYGYDYEDLSDIIEAVRPALSEAGIAVVQLPSTVQRGVLVTTMLIHGSGQWIRNRLMMACEPTDPQAVGSGITYARRYALKAILCLAPSHGEDDDGARAGASVQTAVRPAQRASQQAPREPVAAKPPRGRIRAIEDRGTAVLVELDSGFAAAARDPGLIAALRQAHVEGAVVDLQCEPSSDPARYAPRLIEFRTLAP